MTATSQHGFHPDAESLSAFSEQALNERERAEVLAHLAVCGRCRQVVALAREAADADDKTAAVPPRKTTCAQCVVETVAAGLGSDGSCSGFCRGIDLRLYRASGPAWTKHQDCRAKSGAECNAASSDYANGTSKGRASRRRRSRDPAGAHGEARALCRTRATARASAACSCCANAGGVRSLQSLEPLHLELRIGRKPCASRLQCLAQKSSNHLRSRRWETTALLTRSLATVRRRHSRSRPKNIARQKWTRRACAALRPSPRQPGYTARTNAAPQSSTQTVTVTASPQLETQPAAPPEPAPMLGFKHVRGAVTPANPMQLPSGLASVSIASRGHFLLAIDKAGALFLSEDRGVTWERITKQWTGRAVEVHRHVAANDAMQTAPAAQNGTTGNSSAGTGAASPPPYHLNFQMTKIRSG